MEFSHIPVMPNECIEGLNIKQGGTYVDGTTGGGGHSKLILKALGERGKLVCIDRDQNALDSAKMYLKNCKNVNFVKANFSDVVYVLNDLQIATIDGMLLDLGVSSYQIDTAARGFSYMLGGPLDMRMDQNSQLTAKEIVNNYSRQELMHILRDFGEEEFAPIISKNIEFARANKPIETTLELVAIIEKSIPAAVRFKRGGFSKKVFQALRIAVNGELKAAERGIRDGFDKLKKGGRLCVITFHSLEDRLVKNIFNEFAQGCSCIEYSPICVCGKKPRGKIITKKPILPAKQEQQNNSRSKSAKLRIIEKL